MSKMVLVVASTLALAGCATAPIGSVGGGECKIVHTPQYRVLGKTSYDQAWVDHTTEAIVVGCKQSRPKARPASLDAPQKSPPSPPASSPAKKKRLRDDLKRIMHL